MGELIRSLLRCKTVVLSAGCLFLVMLLVGCGRSSTASATTESDQPTSQSQVEKLFAEADREKAAREEQKSSSQDIRTAVSQTKVQPTVFEEQSEPEPVFRPSDTRAQPDQNLLTKLGLHVVESKRIRLISDLPLDKLKSLPALVDALYDELVLYFGALPANRERTEFQLTGYLMSDIALFRDSGLLPKKFAQLQHGRHQGAEFWMTVPTTDYYLKHLMLHEATHCYMMFLPRISAPVWYLEGMAELFATHRVDATGKVQFRVFPEATENYSGFGRIELIAQDIEQAGLKSVSQVEQLENNGYTGNLSYAWAWALCTFLDQHARYKERFQLASREFLLESTWDEAFLKKFAADHVQLNQEWLSFISELSYGTELSKIEIDFTAGKILFDRRKVQVMAANGWQNTGLKLVSGQTYQLTAKGQFSLGKTTRSWDSTAAGISFQYHRDIPIGRLLGAICPEKVSIPEQEKCFADFANFGEKIVFKAPYTGTLHLRLNESPSQLADNSGGVEVQVKRERK